MESSKGMNGLAHSSHSDRLLHRFRKGQIDLDAEQIGKTILKMDHSNQGEPLRTIEVGHEIDIRPSRLLTPRDGAKEAQMNDPRSPQLRLVLAQRLDDG
jgi:hypothetical protein